MIKMQRLLPLFFGSLIGMSVSLSASAQINTPSMKGGQSEAEFLAEADKAFREADTNYDGLITRAERNMARQKQRESRHKTTFQDMDQDGNSHVSRWEYDAHVKSQMEKFEDRSRQTTQKWFDNLDKDKDGYISRREAEEGRMVGNSKFSPEKIKERQDQTYKSMDQDGNGHISETEYLDQMTGKNRKRQKQLARKAAATAATAAAKPTLARVKRDGNADGKISRQENEAYYKYLFKTRDKDGDGYTDELKVPSHF